MTVQFPGGTILRGAAVGGQFASAKQIAQAGVEMRGSVPGVRFSSRFPQIEAELQIRCHAQARATAEAVRSEARQNLLNNESYITGDLYNSLEVIELDRTQDWAVASDIYYAPYVEFGTSTNRGGPGNAPKPYLVPAVAAHRDDYITEQQKAVAEACL